MGQLNRPRLIHERVKIWRYANWQGETEALEEKPAPVPLFFTTNPTWNVLGFNSELRGGKPATNRLIGTVLYTRIHYYHNRQQQQHGLGSSRGLLHLQGLKLQRLKSKLFSPSLT
jgi:hypothetical protein